MQIDEILHSCANAHVARAALVSIGGDFAVRVERAAFEYGLTPGAFAAVAVRKFGQTAHPDTRVRVARAMCGADQPVLRGLRVILETVLEAGEDADDMDDEPEPRRRRGDWSKALGA